MLFETQSARVVSWCLTLSDSLLRPAPRSSFLNRLALLVYWKPFCHWWLPSLLRSAPTGQTLRPGSQVPESHRCQGQSDRNPESKTFLLSLPLSLCTTLLLLAVGWCKSMCTTTENVVDICYVVLQRTLQRAELSFSGSLTVWTLPVVSSKQRWPGIYIYELLLGPSSLHFHFVCIWFLLCIEQWYLKLCCLLQPVK